MNRREFFKASVLGAIGAAAGMLVVAKVAAKPSGLWYMSKQDPVKEIHWRGNISNTNIQAIIEARRAETRKLHEAWGRWNQCEFWEPGKYKFPTMDDIRRKS